MSTVEFGFLADLDLGDAEYEIKAFLSSGSSLAMRGSLEVSGREFRLSIVSGKGTRAIVGVFSSEHDAPVKINLRDLASSISADLAALVPDVNVSIRGAMFALVRADIVPPGGRPARQDEPSAASATPGGSPGAAKPELAGSALVFGVDFDTAIDLSDLPLVGPRLAGGKQAGLNGLKIVASSADLDAGALDLVKRSLADTGFDLTGSDTLTLPKGPRLSALVQFNELVSELTLPMSSSGPLPQSTSGSADPPASSGSGPIPIGTTPPVSSIPDNGNGIKWIDLNKTFGPVSVGRIGLLMSDGQVGLQVDAGMRLGPLQFGVDGLGVSNPLDAIDPKFSLEGLSLDYAAGPIKIAGGLLYDARDGSFVGMAEIRGPGLSITAMGGYQQLDGEASLFLYALLDRPLGGPAFFFVTGLALGFGYNRGLVLPSAENIPQFPFVQAAIKGPTSVPVPVLTTLKRLKRVVPARRGEMFLAAGIKFTSFLMLDSFVLLIVRLGNEVSVDMLGITRLSAPISIPPAKVLPIVQAELAIRAGLNLTRGSLLVRGVLTDNSYILSRSCRLTGGFAFACWFADQRDTPARAGDFVATLGGYHPSFKVPAHYPNAPRVGLHWQVTRELSIKGGIYMALTPQCIMAGGRFSAVFQQRNLRASFVMSADFLVAWQPYQYQAQMSVRFAFSYRVRVDFGWFGELDKTLSFSLSAGLRIWGPEFGGTAHISVTVVSFTVDFGAPALPPPPISWLAFEASFLPPSAQRLSLAISEGQLQEVDGLPIVDGAAFRMELNSVIPIRDDDASNSAFGIAPMGVKRVHTSACTITVRKNGTLFNDLVLEPILKSAPMALWGTSRSTNPNAPALLDNLVMGYRLVSAPTVEPKTTAQRPVSDFNYDIETISGAFALIAAPMERDRPRKLAAVASNLATAGATRNRKRMLDSLGLLSDSIRLDNFIKQPDDAMVTSPRVVG